MDDKILLSDLAKSGWPSGLLSLSDIQSAATVPELSRISEQSTWISSGTMLIPIMS